MNKAYLDKNIADCERRIDSLELRVKAAVRAEGAGEDVDWLNDEIDGYREKLEELSQTEPD